MQIELAQISMIDGNIPHNTGKVLDAIHRADVAGGTELMVFPETALTGFPSRDNVHELAQPLDGPSLTAVKDAAKRKGVAVAVGFSECDADRFYNATVLIDKTGEVVLHYRKTHSWASDVGIFTPGDRFVATEWNGITVGILICFDIEFPEAARAVASLGADLLIVTNGNMDPYGPVHARSIAARAMENQIYAVMVNRVGQGEGMTFPGESAVIDPFGDQVVYAGRTETILKATPDFSRIAESRADYTYLRQARVGHNLKRADKDGIRILELMNA